MTGSCWLMKAEPESRIVNGRDVAFSADIFEKAGVEHWDGVRNHQAKGFMKDKMRVGDRVLFYHSNCKLPGIAALAEVAREGYPDFTAFDKTHPYYDPKSSEDKPTWYMVDVRFVSHLDRLVPLSLLQSLASAAYHSLPEHVRSYLSEADVKAIKEMPLLARGRLSVQPASAEAYEAVKRLGEQGGWGEMLAGAGKKGKSKKTKEGGEAGKGRGKREKKADEGEQRVSRPKRARKAS